MANVRKSVERTADEALRVGAWTLRSLYPKHTTWEPERQSAVEDAVATSGFVAATAHWSAPSRLPFLAQLIKGLDKQGEPFSLAAYVNGPCLAEEVAAKLRPLFADDPDITIECATDIADFGRRVVPVHGKTIVLADWRRRGNPYRLTWQHKTLFRELSSKAHPFNGLLIYLEDDIELSPDSLQYWRTYRPLLAPHGFIPGFLRVEGPVEDRRVCGWPRSIVKCPGISFSPLDPGDTEPLSFVAISNPYQAMYILDASLARMHFAKSDFRGRIRGKFSRERGRIWGVPERAAVGALFDGVRPDGYLSRALTAMQYTADGSAIPYPPCLIDHVSQNYYRNPKTRMSKQVLSEAFRAIS